MNKRPTEIALLQSACRGALLLACTVCLSLDMPRAVQAATLGEISVSSYGAKADGVTDNTAAFQKALDAAAFSGAIVRIPPGQYEFSGTLNVPAQVVLKGVNVGERTYGGYEGGKGLDPVANIGTVFLVVGGAGSAAGPPFLTLNANSGLKDVTFYYPDQADPSALASWTPTPYPFTISMIGANGSIENVCGINPYQFIEAASSTGRSVRESIRRVDGCPLLTGVYVDNDGDGSGNCADTLDDIHFVPSYGNGTGSKWVTSHATAFQINHAEEIVMRTCFCFLYGTGIHFGVSPSGSASGTIVNCGVDSSQNAVLIEGVQANAGGLAFEGGGYSGGALGHGYAVNIANTNRGNVTFNGSRFWGTPRQLISNAGARGSVFSLYGCYFLDWGYLTDANGKLLDPNYGNVQTEQLNPDLTCILCGDKDHPYAAGGKTRIVNCQFKHNQYDYTYTPGEAGVLFEGNNVPNGVHTQGITSSMAGPSYIQTNNF